MEFNHLNMWAVVVAWFVNMIVGSLWYSSLGFAKRWQAYTGIDMLKIPTKEANRTIGFVALSALAQALTLAVVIHSLHLRTAAGGLVAGLVLWFGLVTATTVGVTLYSRRSWKFLWLNSSYFLLVMAVNSVLLSVWR